MTAEILLLSWSWTGAFWGFLSFLVFLFGILLTLLILIQDSKDTGLTSAFGGGGGSALMGASMQKDLAKFTAILAVAFAICLIIMGIITRFGSDESIGTVTSGAPPPAATLPLPGEPAAAPSPGAQPGLPLDPLAPPITPQPSGDGGGFPAGLGSIPQGAITAPGETKKDSTAAPAIAPDAPPKAPESVAPPGTGPAPAEKAAVPAPPPAPEGSPPPASTAPPEGPAGGTSPPPSR